MAKKKETKAVEATAVAVQEPAQLPMKGSEQPAWGMEEIGASDIIMPKLLLMQGLSKMVSDGEAKLGEIVNSLTKEAIGGITNIKTKECKSVEVVTFKAFKTWLEFDKVEGQWVYRRNFPHTVANADLALEETVNGIEVRRDLCLNYYVLLPDEIKAGSALPYVISFRRTSMPAGKKIASAQTRWKALGAPNPVCHKSFLLSVVMKTKETNNYWAFEVEEGKNTDKLAQDECKKWYMALQKMNVKIDDSDLAEEATVVSEAQEY